MLTITNFLINSITVVHWIFRVLITWNYYEERAFVVQPYNYMFEMVLLFLTLFLFIWILKKKIWAGLIYFSGYGIYYGAEIYNFFVKTQSQYVLGNLLKNYNIISDFVCIFAVFLGFVYILSYKGKAGDKRMKRMEWFFGKGNHERNYDERADRNQYKF